MQIWQECHDLFPTTAYVVLSQPADRLAVLCFDIRCGPLSLDDLGEAIQAVDRRGILLVYVDAIDSCTDQGALITLDTGLCTVRSVE